MMMTFQTKGAKPTPVAARRDGQDLGFGSSGA
jgi:hypothetical protein